jgi:Uma2 family endonuclease
MNAIATEPTYTPEALLSLPDGGKGYELVDGRLVEKKTGGHASSVAARIVHLLVALGEDLGLGWVFDSEGSYHCFPDHPRKVRKPDVSFIRRGRLPDERIPTGHILIPPDLAVEVVSPNDTVYELHVKIEEYIAAGVPLVWVLNPEARNIHIYRGSDSVERLGEDDELTAPDLIPALRLRVGVLFNLGLKDA